MKLNKHDPETEMDMDMTPMIDVVFLLIIFFMIITDMTQQDLEDLKLPVAKTAVADKPNPDEFRPVVNIIASGEIWVMGDQIYDPENDDEYGKLKAYLKMQSTLMEEEPLDEAQPSGPQVKADPLLVRADQSTPFKHVQKVMELCGLEGIQIWKVQLAAAESAPAEGEESPE